MLKLSTVIGKLKGIQMFSANKKQRPFPASRFTQFDVSSGEVTVDLYGFLKSHEGKRALQEADRAFRNLETHSPAKRKAEDKPKA